MLEHKNVLVIGARAGGYGPPLQLRQERRANVSAHLSPGRSREQAFFADIRNHAHRCSLRFDSDHRDRVCEDFQRIGKWLNDNGVDKLDAVIHTVAGGFPRQPSVMRQLGTYSKANKLLRHGDRGEEKCLIT